MKLGQKVLVTWGTYKGLTGVITEIRYTKNITLKLDSKPYEIEVSSDHLEVVEEQLVKSVTVLDKIQEVLGDNYTIQSKKVTQLLTEQLHGYEFHKTEQGYLSNIHYFTINKPYKVQGHQFDYKTIKATKLKSGVWKVTE
ncbi:hypothetical protein [Bacillus infantis]|uniref:hypothetical protein n=1 Tax=Bacillus infantis TaxID=324767 RepID=UPI00209D3421|nr:hypothetical protein [Bacillus infantis]MCP1159405.1 hypothetical protein [Bacillus infantis]